MRLLYVEWRLPKEDRHRINVFELKGCVLRQIGGERVEGDMHELVYATARMAMKFNALPMIDAPMQIANDLAGYVQDALGADWKPK